MHEKIRIKAASEISIRSFLSGQSLREAADSVPCKMQRYVLQDRMEIILWESHWLEPQTFYLYDDTMRINFTCVLSGEYKIIPDILCKESRENILGAGGFCISHTPGCHGKAFYKGIFKSITLSLHPELLADIATQAFDSLKQCSSSYYCYCQYDNYSAELKSVAQMLWNTLITPAVEEKNTELLSMWIKGQGLVMLSLMLQKHLNARQGYCPDCPLQQTDRQKLIKAKALLLADLSKAPTIPELAQRTGLSVLKVKKGFRLLFNNSVYGLFQAERMLEARRQLLRGNVSVITVASDLGYANASHFSAAFRKQFGILPSAFKRSVQANGDI